jgi:hypothetical protein
MYKTIYTEIEVNLNEFDTEDLIEELESRNADFIEYSDNLELLATIYHKRRTGQDFTKELDELIYSTIGRIV